MSTVFERLAPGARVAVIRLRSLGDCVLTTPALALLKQARPDLRIGVVVEDAFAPLFAGNPDVECVLRPIASEISSFRPRLSLNLHGGATSVRLTLASRSRLRAGFTHFRFQPIYNIRIPRAQEILEVDRKVHTAEHLASAIFFLGAPISPIPRAKLFAKRAARERPYAVLHPMASAPDKIWPHSNFLTLADHMERNFGLEPIFIAGPGENLGAFRRFTTVEGASLEEIKSLLAGATLFIGNDSGPAHMAAAYGIPVVVLFGSSDPEIWRPWQTESVVLKNPNGIQSIGMSEALRAIETLRVPSPESLVPRL
jgi:heptosyltransferase III